MRATASSGERSLKRYWAPRPLSGQVQRAAFEPKLPRARHCYAHGMTEDSIAQIEIDAAGRLLLLPQSASFPSIYREAMEVGWDRDRRALFGPKPTEWSYTRWFEQLVAATSEQGVRLLLTPSTKWTNVPPEVRAEIEIVQADPTTTLGFVSDLRIGSASP
jgi:hypothetical protein